jgi:hypothetical protein
MARCQPENIAISHYIEKSKTHIIVLQQLTFSEVLIFACFSSFFLDIGKVGLKPKNTSACNI